MRIRKRKPLQMDTVRAFRVGYLRALDDLTITGIKPIGEKAQFAMADRAVLKFFGKRALDD